MKSILKCLILIFFLTALMGCASGDITKRDVATVGGGVGGGLLGSSLTGGSTVGTIGGALGGAYIGNQLAK